MSLNPIAALIVAGYLLLAIRNNNEQLLLKLLGEEGGFIKWIVALGIVLWIYNAAPSDGKKVIGGFLMLATVAVVLQSKEAINQLSALLEL